MQDQETVYGSNWPLTINNETVTYIMQVLVLDKSKPTIEYKLIIINRLSIM